ncbi:hemagglutinin [Pseudomonas aeruginosa VRFPA09]|nr:hemagglutinin [Pseudomonas aeruginosa VRFPA09]
MDIRSPLNQCIALSLAGILFLNPIVAAAAGLALDKAAGGNTGLGQAGNGVPIVNIATPNGAGLSNNHFRDYNVGANGLILNNATGKTQGTQLGGIILGNPNLKGQAAQVILNQVTGGNRSTLAGYTEVAGQSARVIVANPHGITCQGCGFINTPRATLTTGKPIMDGQRLERFQVDGGDIVVEGAELNVGNLEQFDLITRSAKLNAKLYAKNLNIVTGRNDVQADSLQATPRAADGSEKPQLAIDSSALGGMYAGAIRLVGTEQGVGVKLAGDMAASGGDIRIDASGKLSLAQASSQGDLKIAAQAVELNGKTYAGGSAEIRSAEELVNRQSLAARERIALEAAHIDNAGVIEAGVEPDERRNARGDTLGGSLPGVARVQGVPGNATPSASHKYLIETNPALTELKQFLNSDYLLSGLGMNPDDSKKRLGDGLYEQRLIRDAVVARTGQRYIDGLSSDEALFRYLMDNAIAYKDKLQLQLGVGLSAEQMAALTHDIVWLEEVEVNGEKVLAPVVYLAQAEGRLAPNGALIQGRDVKLVSGGDLHNVGTLRARNDLSATADNLDNSGLIEAGKRLDLLAGDSIRNRQGGVIAGRDVSLTALTGDVINERSVTRYDSALDGRTWERSFADSAARVEAANSLNVQAGRDIANLGGVLQSRGDLSLDAGRDVTVAAVEDRQGQTRWNTSRLQSVTQLGAEVSAGRDLNVSAGRDLSAVASALEARRDIALSAGRDVTLAAAANEEHAYSKTRKVTYQEDKVAQQGTRVDAGGDLAINAGQDLRLIASQASAGDEAYLVAGDKLELLAANDSNYYLYDKKKKGDFGRKETRRDEVTDVKAVGSQISSGGDLTLLSGGDQTYQGAKLESGNDLAIVSGGAVTFEAVKDLHQESHEKSKGDLAWQSSKGKGQTDETVRQTQIVAQGNLAIKAVEGLKIDLKHIDQKTVSQTIDAMVQADPQLAWLKEAEQRGDVDWRRVQEVHDSWKYSNSGLGAAPSLAIAIVAAAYLGPVYGPMASNLAVGTINNGGDLGKGLQHATSSSALKSYAIAAATAYLTTEYFDKVLDTKTNVDTSKVTVDLSTVSGASRFAANQAMQNLTSTALGKAMGQGGSFGDALKDSLYNTFAAAGFNAIGDFGKTHKLETGSAQMVVMHALMGGLAAQARGDSFAAGAIGAGLNEALVKDLDKLVSSYSPENREAMLAMASQLTGLVGVVAKDPGASYKELETGSWAARNSVQYNYLNHEENQERFEAKKACNGGDSTACGRVDELNQLDRSRDLALLTACSSDGSSTTCTALRKEAWESAQSLKQASWTPEAQEQYRQAMQNPQLMAYTIEGELRSIYQINDPITAADSKRLAEAMASLGSDFIPGYGDGKAFVEAQDPFDYTMAGIGLVPGIGDGAAKILAKAKALYKEGKVSEAADLVEGLGKLPAPQGPKGTGTALREVEVSSGSKGSWTKELNKPEPNTIYKVDGNKTYQTDSLGRVEKVESNLSLTKSDRNTYQQCIAGKCGVSGDEGGHLIASIFNGPGEKLNLLPMNGNLNKGAWKSMENTWSSALKQGQMVSVKIEPVYSGSSVRPDRFTVRYSIDGGRPVIVDFKNSPGGI